MSHYCQPVSTTSANIATSFSPGLPIPGEDEQNYLHNHPCQLFLLVKNVAVGVLFVLKSCNAFFDMHTIIPVSGLYVCVCVCVCTNTRPCKTYLIGLLFEWFCCKECLLHFLWQASSKSTLSFVPLGGGVDNQKILEESMTDQRVWNFLRFSYIFISFLHTVNL